MPRILLLSSQPVLPGSIVKDLLEKGDADLAKIDIITNSGTLKPGLLAKDRYAAVFAFAEEAALHDLQFLSELQKSLASGGEVTIVERGHTDTKSLEKKLVIAGFIECKTEVSPSGDAMIEARKPAWSNPKGQSINLSGQRNGTSQLNRSTNGTLNTANTTAQPNQISALSAEDTGDDDLLDDDDLLLEEDKQRPSGYDCGVSTTKKACKNCTCGRADGEKVEVKLTQEMLENPQSGGCGSCGLGDAFRCGTCPYRGLPTFEMGKKIQLPSDFLTADI